MKKKSWFTALTCKKILLLACLGFLTMVGLMCSESIWVGKDDSAFVLTAYHTNDPYLYVLKTYHRKKMTFDDVAEKKIQEFMRNTSIAPNRVKIIDGANKQGVESMRHRSNIPFEYADKQDKATFIELCNNDLIQGLSRC